MPNEIKILPNIKSVDVKWSQFWPNKVSLCQMKSNFGQKKSIFDQLTTQDKLFSPSCSQMDTFWADFPSPRVEDIFFKKMGQSRPLFLYFCSFHISIQMKNIQFEHHKLKKAEIVCWGLKPRVAWWTAQMNPLSYGGTPS